MTLWLEIRGTQQAAALGTNKGYSWYPFFAGTWQECQVRMDGIKSGASFKLDVPKLTSELLNEDTTETS